MRGIAIAAAIIAASFVVVRPSVSGVHPVWASQDSSRVLPVDEPMVLHETRSSVQTPAVSTGVDVSATPHRTLVLAPGAGLVAPRDHAGYDPARTKEAISANAHDNHHGAVLDVQRGTGVQATEVVRASSYREVLVRRGMGRSDGVRGLLPEAHPKPCHWQWWRRCREITPETKPTTPSVLPKGCAYQATTKDQVRCVLAENGMDWAWWVADCIISHESGWNRYAVSPTSDYGLWQLNRINLYLLKGRPYYDPVANTEAAIALYRLALSYWGDGWRPWSSTARSCGV